MRPTNLRVWAPGVAQVDVEDHADATVVTAIDKLLQAVRSAVTVLNCVREDSVVSPAVSTREGGHRQYLDEVHAEIYQVIEPLNRGLEGARRGERADVQLVDKLAEQLPPSPAFGLPVECGVVDQPTTDVVQRGDSRGNSAGSKDVNGARRGD